MKRYILTDQPIEVGEGGEGSSMKVLQDLLSLGVIREYNFPEKGQRFYYLSSSSTIQSATWGDNPTFNKLAKALNNVFETKEEALAFYNRATGK